MERLALIRRVVNGSTSSVSQRRRIRKNHSDNLAHYIPEICLSDPQHCRNEASYQSSDAMHTGPDDASRLK